MTRFTKIVVVLLILALLPTYAVLAQEGDTPVLLPFTDQEMGIEGVRPEGWSQVARGVFQRQATPDDITALIEQSALGVTVDQITGDLLPRLGLDALPDAVTTLESGTLSWSVYLLELEIPEMDAVMIDMALAERAEGSYIVLLQTTAPQYDALHESVFQPALEAFSAFSLNWAQDAPVEFAPEMEPAQLIPEVLDVRPHDASAYTQGLLFFDGSLYESAGLYGQSTLRELDPQTGDVLRTVDVPEQYFAEGLTRVDDRLIQITWKENEALVYDIDTFEQVDTYAYEGEGWGLCNDGQYLYMSNGSPFITIRDPQTFEIIDRGLVTLMGRPADELNELECVGDYLYANVWKADFILQIDKTTGNVVGMIDASGLLTDEERADLVAGSEVLNGIVYLPESETFLITGKHWPTMYEVEFVPVPEEAPAPDVEATEEPTDGGAG